MKKIILSCLALMLVSVTAQANWKGDLRKAGIRATGEALTITVPTTMSGAGTLSGAVSITGDVTTDNNVGTVAGTGVTVTEYGTGEFHKTVFTFTDVAVTLADEAGVVAYGGLKIYDFPEGYIYTIAASSDIALTKSSTGVNADWAGS